MGKIRIGVIGYGSRIFNVKHARRLLEFAIDTALAQAENVTSVEIVTDLIFDGVPAIAYTLAEERGYRCAGYSCELSRYYGLYPADRCVVVGVSWADARAAMLDNIDVLIRIGGDNEALRMAILFERRGGTTIELELEAALVWL